MANATQQIDELRQEVQHLAEMVQDNIPETGNGSSIHFNRRELRRMARKAGRNVRGYLVEKSHQAAELRDKAEVTISERPLTSIAAALAGGILIGALLKRK